MWLPRWTSGRFALQDLFPNIASTEESSYSTCAGRTPNSDGSGIPFKAIARAITQLFP
jgi:hypothetical protein